jgi:hypothetical protein
MTHGKEVAYISGAISSDPNYKAKFADAEMVLDHLGYVVLNPTSTPLGLNYDEYMRIDLLLVEIADTLVMLPDWMQSDGATLEHDHAVKLGKRIIDYKGISTQSSLACKKRWLDYLKNS